MTHPQLATLVTELDAATARAQSMAAPLDDATFRRRPPSGGWSAAECVAHLNLTTIEYLPLLDAALAKGRAGFPETGRYRKGFVGWLLAWSLEPPARIRIRTLPRFVPGSVGPKQSIVAEFERLQRELRARIERSSGIHLEELRITSPFNEKASYNVYAAYCVLLSHERRHIWQAERAARPGRAA